MNEIAIYEKDHTTEWRADISKDGWVLAHNAIRGELSDFAYVLIHLKRRDLTPKHAKHIRLWWKGHSEHVYGHHYNEDHILNPFIRTKTEYPEKLEKDHTYLVNCMDEIDDCIKTVPIDVKLLTDKWTNYMNFMNAHLWEEEEVGIPLVRKYLSPQEFQVPLQAILKKSTPIELGSFIYYNGGKVYIQKFMRQEKIPWFVWYIVFRRHSKYYKQHMIKSLEFLKYN